MGGVKHGRRETYPSYKNSEDGRCTHSSKHPPISELHSFLDPAYPPISELQSFLDPAYPPISELHSFLDPAYPGIKEQT